LFLCDIVIYKYFFVFSGLYEKIALILHFLLWR